MTRVLGLLFASVTFLALATPARAENWVTFGDPWIWNDIDSITTSGNVVSWTLRHSYESGVSPLIGGGGTPTRVGIDCSTRQLYNVRDGVFGASGFIASATRGDYVFFCTAYNTEAARSTAAPSASALLASWRIEDMAAQVRRQNGATDGLLLTDAEGRSYLVATTTRGNSFSITRRCSSDGTVCSGAFFHSYLLFPSSTAAERFMTTHGGVTYGLHRDGDVVRIGAYLILDNGITTDNLAANIAVFMRDVDLLVGDASQFGAAPTIR